MRCEEIRGEGERKPLLSVARLGFGSHQREMANGFFGLVELSDNGCDLRVFFDIIFVCEHISDSAWRVRDDDILWLFLADVIGDAASAVGLILMLGSCMAIVLRRRNENTGADVR